MRSAPAVWCCGLTYCSRRTASPPLNSSVRCRLSHMGKHLAIAFCAAVFPFTALASQSWPPTVRDPGECLTNPGVVAPCFSFHGRMSLANGSPSLRIWRIGTKRILGVLPSENPVVPTAIRKRLAFGVEFFGNFEVCPFTVRKPGRMQMVCVQRASNVVVQIWPSEDSGSPKITRLPGTYTLAPNNSFQRTEYPRR